MSQKKGLIHKLIVGSDKAEGYARSTLPSNRWELFWDILKGRFWKLVILNLMLIVGLIPVGIVMLYRAGALASSGAEIPFSGSYIIGYHQMPGVYESAMAAELFISIQAFIMLIPAILIAAVVFSGVFHIVRNLAWNEGVFLANDFFKGIKANIGNFLLVGLCFGVLLFISNLNIASLDQAPVLNPGSFLAGSFVNLLFKGLTYVFMGFFTIMTMFAFTINVTYKLKFTQLVRNSFLLTLGLLVRNIFFLVLCLLPFVLIIMFSTSMLIGFIMGVVLLLGFSGAVLGWTVYSQWAFDMFINDKVEGAVKNKGIYQKMDKEGKPVSKKPAQQQRFANPKKKRTIKPVTDEDITLTELPTAFSRADLRRLEEEKEVMRVDSEKWADEHEDIDDDTDTDMDVYGEEYNGYEDAMLLDGYEGEQVHTDDESPDEDSD